MGLRIELQCDACGETAQVAVSNNPAPTPADFAEEETPTGRGILGELENAGWRLQVVKGVVVAACCPAHWDEAARRLRGELGARKAVRQVTETRCHHCGKRLLPEDVASDDTERKRRCVHCGQAV